MDESTEKRVKRPRIGENKGEAVENESRYGGFDSRNSMGADDQGAVAGYSQNYNRPRPYGNQGGYNRQGGYGQGGYGNRQQGGGYGNRQQGGGYGNRQQGGGYGNRQQGGGYGNRQQGGG